MPVSRRNVVSGRSSRAAVDDDSVSVARVVRGSIRSDPRKPTKKSQRFVKDTSPPPILRDSPSDAGRREVVGDDLAPADDGDPDNGLDDFMFGSGEPNADDMISDDDGEGDILPSFGPQLTLNDSEDEPINPDIVDFSQMDVGDLQEVCFRNKLDIQPPMD